MGPETDNCILVMFWILEVLDLNLSFSKDQLSSASAEVKGQGAIRYYIVYTIWIQDYF